MIHTFTNEKLYTCTVTITITNQPITCDPSRVIMCRVDVERARAHGDASWDARSRRTASRRPRMERS